MWIRANMKPTVLQWTAVISLLAAGAVEAARRPVYGGELRVEMRAVLNALDPAQSPVDPVALGSWAQLIPSVFETLVRLDERGDPQPWLATAWTHDASRKRWVFTTRPGVMLHNGSMWSPAAGAIEVAD